MDERSGRVFEPNATRLIRVKIPKELRTSMKILQLKSGWTADQAVTEIFKAYFAVNPQ